MNEKNRVLAVTAALICIVILASSPVIHAQPTLKGEVGDIEVTICTEEIPTIYLSSEENLFNIEYTTLQFRPVEGPLVDVPLEGDWEISTETVDHDRFPHLKVSMSTALILQEEEIDLNFDFKVISVKDTTEMTFSFEITGLKGELLGDFYIVQNIEVNGQILQKPGLPGQEPVMFYQFELPGGLTGYYSWSSFTHIDSSTQEAMVDVLNDGYNLFLGVSYNDPEADRVSISSIEIEKSMSSALVPVPEAYDHFPSFLVGMLVAGGFVIGMLFQERNRFYKKEDSTSIVRLEDSPYYRGKE